MEAINILHISKKIPYPQRDGESVVSYSLAKSLSRFNEISIDLLSLHTNKHTTDEEEAKRELAVYRNISFVDHDLTIDPISLLQTMLSGESYNIRRFKSTVLLDQLRILLKKEQYTFVLLETIYTTPYVKLIRELSPLSRIILRLHNVEHLIWGQRAANESNPLKRYLFHRLSRQLKQYKQNVLPSVDKVITISSTDHKWMTGNKLMKTDKLHYLPVGLTVSKKPQASSKENAVLHIGFIGSMDWDPNTSGLEWFIQQVWQPHISTLNTVKLHLAGRKYAVGLYSSIDGVKEHGEVADATAFLDKLDVLIVPLFIGSGVRIKILEAMCRGIAVISTSIGIAGIDVIADKHAMIANTENEFINAIQTLSIDRGKLVALQQNAYNFAEENYSQDKMAESLLNMLIEMTQ